MGKGRSYEKRDHFYRLYYRAKLQRGHLYGEIAPQFPDQFHSFGHRVELQILKQVLKVDESEIPIKRTKPTESQTTHGRGLTVETPLRAVYRGNNLILRFYQDGAINIVMGDKSWEIKSLNIRNGLIEIHYTPNKKFVAPLKPEALQIDTKYNVDMDVTTMRVIRLTQRLRMKFRYDDIGRLRSNIRAGRYMVKAKFDNARTVSCESPELHINVPQGATRLQSVEVKLGLEGMIEELHNRLIGKEDREWQEEIRHLTQVIGNVGEGLTEAKNRGELFEMASEISKIPKERLLLVGPNYPGPDFIFFVKDTSQRAVIVEVKSTLKHANLNDRLKDAIDELRDHYFRWNEFKHIRYGIPVAVYYNYEELLSSGLSSGFEIIIGGATENPNFEP